MSGSLQKKGKYYYAVVYLNDESGERKAKWISTKCQKKGDAEKFLRKILSSIDDNTFVMPKKVTFSVFIIYWLNNVIKNEVEQTTWESYELVVGKHIVPYFKGQLNDISLQDLQPLHLQKYYQDKFKGNESTAVKGLSAITLSKHHANIKKALDYAVRMKLISFNPADRIQLPKKDKYHANYYTVEQLEKLFEVCLGTPIESAVYIAAHYGLRRGEVLGLKWDAINFKEQTITIRETIVKFGKNAITKKPKSESSLRTLPLMNNIGEYLKSLKNNQKKNKLQFGKDYNDEGFVCCWSDGSQIKTDYLNHTFKKILEKNNLSHIRFHDLRHSAASYLIKHGVDLKNVQAWLGHADFSTTANTYAHIDDESKKNTANTINNIFNSFNAL
jgi:integrase